MSRRLFRIVLFALTALRVAAAQNPIKAEPTHYKLAFENEYVQVVNMHYGPHEKSVLHAHPAGVVVNLTAAHLRFTDEQGKAREVDALRGEARWFPALKHRVENLGNTPYDGVYIAFKGNPSTGTNVGRSEPPMNAATKELVARALAAVKH